MSGCPVFWPRPLPVLRHSSSVPQNLGDAVAEVDADGVSFGKAAMAAAGILLADGEGRSVVEMHM